jgi:hypothetical protein
LANVYAYPYGNTKISTAQYKFGSSSIYFDGNGDYLEIGPVTELDLNNYDWTIEWWEYRTGVADAESTMTGFYDSSNYNFILNYPESTIYTNHYFRCTDGTTVSWRYKSGAPVTNSWTHYAVVRSGTHIYTYVNGIRVDDNTTIGTKTIRPFTFLRIARHYNNTDSNNYEGYLAELRFSIGIARYTGASFTLPTEKYTKDSYDKFLFHFEGTNNSTFFLNSVNDYPLVTSNGVINSTTQYKFGTGSLYFNNNGCYIPNIPRYVLKAVTNENFWFYTISFWWRPGNVTDKQVLFSHRANGSTNNTMVLNYENNSGTKLLRLKVYNATGDGVYSEFTKDASSLNTDTWYFITVEKNDHYHSIWINDSRTYNAGAGNFEVYHSSEPFRIGYDVGDLSSYPLLDSYIDDFRVNAGVRIIPNVPTSELVYNNTDVLALLGNGTNNSQVILNTLTENIASIITSVSPLDNSYIFTNNTNLVINFSASVTAGTGNIIIYNSSDDTIFQTIAANSGNVTVNGSEVTISHNNFVVGNDYYIKIDATAFINFPGISDKTTWNFGIRTAYSKNIVNSFKTLGQAIKGKVAVKWGTGLKWGDGTKWGQTVSFQEYFKNLTANLKLSANKNIGRFKNLVNNLSISDLITKISGGTIIKTLTTSLNFTPGYKKLSSTINTTDEDYRATVVFANNKILEVYDKGYSGSPTYTRVLYGKIGTYNGNDITWGNEQTLFSTNNISNLNRLNLTKLSDNKVVIGYNYQAVSSARILTISNDIISWGGSQTFKTGSSYGISEQIRISDSRFLVVDDYYQPQIFLCDVSGTTITKTTNTTGLDSSVVSLTKLDTDKYLVICPFGKLYGRILTIDGNTLNITNRQELSAENVKSITIDGVSLTGISSIDTTTNNAIVCYNQSGTYNLKTILVNNNSGTLSVTSTTTVDSTSVNKWYTSLNKIDSNNLRLIYSTYEDKKIKECILNNNNSIQSNRNLFEEINTVTINNSVELNPDYYISYEVNDTTTYSKIVNTAKSINLIKNTSKFISKMFSINNLVNYTKILSKLITNTIKITNSKINSINKKVNNLVNLNNIKIVNISKKIISNFKIFNLFSFSMNILKTLINDIKLNNYSTYTKNLNKFISNNIKILNLKTINLTKNILTNIKLLNNISFFNVFTKLISNSLNLSSNILRLVDKKITDNIKLLNLKTINLIKTINVNLKLFNNLTKATNKYLNIQIINSNNLIKSINKSIINTINLEGFKIVNILKNISTDLQIHNELQALKTLHKLFVLYLKQDNFIQKITGKTINLDIKVLNNYIKNIYKNTIINLNFAHFKTSEIFKKIQNNINLSYVLFKFINRIKNLTNNLSLSNSKTINLFKYVNTNIKLIKIKTIYIDKIIFNNIKLIKIKTIYMNKFINNNLNINNLLNYTNIFRKLIVNNLSVFNQKSVLISKNIISRFKIFNNYIARLINKSGRIRNEIMSRIKSKGPESRTEKSDINSRTNRKDNDSRTNY